MIDIIKAIGGIFQPAAELVDNIHTSEEERLEAKTKLEEVRKQTYEAAIGLQLEFVNLEKQLVDKQSAIIIAEAKGESKIQRLWRPWSMVGIGSMIMLGTILGWFGINISVPPELWTLFQLGFTGYIVGRSGEKIVQNLRQ